MPPPTAPGVPYTLAHTSTPGWDTPWTPKPAAQGPSRPSRPNSSYGFVEEEALPDENEKRLSGWSRRRKQLRSFILVNTYVPLLFRFINIAFTGAALGMAIRIRNIELRHDAMGAVGSSPTVVIIFAPLTLVHVMAAIYLEYFGRPLGLWRTSAKLAHTLSEVLFICAWSAALSLCFDNFFTSLIPCASASSTAWYNQLPRPISDVPGLEGTYGDSICDFQLSLICLVGVGLIAYFYFPDPPGGCDNVIILLSSTCTPQRVFPSILGMPKASRVRPVAHHSSVKLKKSLTNSNDASTSGVAGLGEVSGSRTLELQLEPERGPVVQQKKKEKQQEKRQAFLQKLEPSTRQFSKSHERRMKRKAREQLSGGLNDLQSALASLEEDARGDDSAPAVTIADAEDPQTTAKSKIKPGAIGKGSSAPLSKAQRKRAFELERLRHPLILKNPDFSSNPFQTIRTHAQNTLLKHDA
ncbi:hypothetical protein NLJ89_g11226 [Agrocybe chaxingu]|uniref:Ribosome biogenesis protein SLX9 n=1 Tax=Agrocybe chaxingu TaxID=84603 RepID=A0A9W8JQD6_9AGAR|nr:hypothetical protein NLJ89_g11226 [Agrocybe chaxingu]